MFLKGKVLDRLQLTWKGLNFSGIWDIWFDNRINESNILTNIIFSQNWYISYPNEKKNMRTSSTWNSILIAWYLTLPNGPFKTITLKKVSTLYWKCIASKTGFKLRYLHLSKRSISFMLSSDNTSALNSAIIKRSSFHCKSAQLSVIKNVGSPSCLTIAKTSCRNFFQYAGVPLNVSKKWLDCFSKTLWQHSCSYCTSANLPECSINFTIQFQLLCHWQCVKNIIRIWCKNLCAIQETLIKVFYWTELLLSGWFITKSSFWE